MARVMLTGRVTDTQAAALKSYAAEVGLPLYQATVRALELGVATLVGGRGEEPEPVTPTDVSAGEIAALREAVEGREVAAAYVAQAISVTERQAAADDTSAA